LRFASALSSDNRVRRLALPANEKKASMQGNVGEIPQVCTLKSSVSSDLWAAAGTRLRARSGNSSRDVAFRACGAVDGEAGGGAFGEAAG
jgi:hypothetical protein